MGAGEVNKVALRFGLFACSKGGEVSFFFFFVWFLV